MYRTFAKFRVCAAWEVQPVREFHKTRVENATILFAADRWVGVYRSSNRRDEGLGQYYFGHSKGDSFDPFRE